MPLTVRLAPTPADVQVVCDACGSELPRLKMLGQNPGPSRVLLDVDAWREGEDGIWEMGRETRQRRKRQGRGPWGVAVSPSDPNDAAFGLRWVTIPVQFRCPNPNCRKVNVMDQASIDNLKRVSLNLA